MFIWYFVVKNHCLIQFKKYLMSTYYVPGCYASLPNVGDTEMTKTWSLPLGNQRAKYLAAINFS